MPNEQALSPRYLVWLNHGDASWETWVWVRQPLAHPAALVHASTTELS